MTSDRVQNNTLMEIFELLKSQDSQAIKSILEILYNASMNLEREEAINASPYERSDQRRGYANGYKDRTLNTRMGKLNLKIPQTRNLDFYPESIERGCRSEKALKVAIAEMYIKGVSTRRVDAITEKLCGLNFSSTQVSRVAKELDEEFNAFRNRPLSEFTYVYLDAQYIKIRHDGSVISMATLIAIGVNMEGKREILGVSAELSEAEVHWREFLKSLVRRGLTGIKLIISDDHSGLCAARESVFPSVPWQRCQFHMSQNAQSYVPKVSMRSEIAQVMRDIFNSPTRELALEMKDRVCKAFKESAPKFVDWLDENIEEGLTCFNFPKEHRKKIRTTNGLERLNREIKRRVRVAVLFPNEESALRLVTGILIEIHEDWVTGTRYLSMS